MDKQAFIAFVTALAATFEAEKFHLQVAKALLSEEPLSASERGALLDEIANRESKHEQQEASIQILLKLMRESS